MKYSLTQAQWIANAYGIGLREASSPNGLYATCVYFTGDKIYGVRFGAGLLAHKSVFSNNTIDHFGDGGPITVSAVLRPPAARLLL